MKFKTLPLSKIHPYAGNPRINSAAIAPVQESIKQFGYMVPIVVDTQNVIILGHTRYHALVGLDAKQKVRVIVTDISTAKANALRIAENRASEISEWDETALMEELRTLENPKDMAPFFPDAELAKLMKQMRGLTTVVTTTESVSRAAKRLTSRFAATAQNATDAVRMVKCAECEQMFGIPKA